MSISRPVSLERLLILLCLVGVAAEVAAFAFLFRGADDVTAVERQPRRDRERSSSANGVTVKAFKPAT